MQGLVLPPRVASVQVILVPIPNSKLTPEEDTALTRQADKIVEELGAAGVRIKADKRDIYTPGWKYNHWETKVKQTLCNWVFQLIPQGGLAGCW